MTFRSFFKILNRHKSACKIRLFGLPHEAKERCAYVMSSFALVWVLSSIVFSASIESPHYRPGLRNSSGSPQLNAWQMQTLLNSLRSKSGFLEMSFDESGFLTLGDRTRFSEGSAIARKLIIDVIDGSKVFELENYDNSPYIAFGRLGEARIFQWMPTNEKIVSQPLQIDFSDFTHLRGGADALATFDVGFVVLHELCHGALNLDDAAGDTIRPGECEEYINRIRRELGLLERAHYSPRLVPMLEGRKSTVRAELLFVGKDNGSEQVRTRRFYLTWDAEKVSVLN